jgi:hypothetical protein
MSALSDLCDSGWEYHRNGVGGRPFVVTCDEHNLRVAFLGEVTESDEPVDEPIVVPLGLIRRLASEPADGLACRGVVADHVAVVAFDMVDLNLNPEMATMVAIQPLDRGPGDLATAVFRVDRLPDVRFGYNSWRGDHHTAYVYNALAAKLARR